MGCAAAQPLSDLPCLGLRHPVNTSSSFFFPLAQPESSDGGPGLSAQQLLGLRIQ